MEFVQDSGVGGGWGVIIEVIAEVLKVSTGVNMRKLQIYRGSKHILQLLLVCIEELAVQIEFIRTQLFEITTPQSCLIE
jgi:hypothetical protein